MANWTLAVSPVNLPARRTLTQARSRTFNFHLSAPSTVAFEMPGRHAETLNVAELATDLRLRRDGVSVFSGRVLESADTFSASDHRTTFQGADIRAVLGRRLVQRERSYVDVDASIVVRDLMIDAQTGPSAGLGISLATIPAVGVPITRVSKAGTSVLSELTEASKGFFDWTVHTFDDGTREPRVWAQRGRATPADALSFVDGEPSLAVAEVSRTPNVADFANQVRVSGGVYRETVTIAVNVTPETRTVGGTEPSRVAVGAADGVPIYFGFVDGATTTKDSFTTFTIDGETFVVPARAVVTNVVQDSSSTSVSIELPTLPVTLDDGTTVHEVGLYALSESYPDIVRQPALALKATERLATARVITPAYTLKLKNGYWQGPSHIWLGDVVSLRLKSGRVDEQVNLRVTDIQLVLGESGEEEVTLTVGATTTITLDVVLDTARRLHRLQTALTN